MKIIIMILTVFLLLWFDEHVLTMFIKSNFGRTLVDVFLWIIVWILYSIFFPMSKETQEGINNMMGGGGSSNNSNDWFNNNSANF